MHIENKNVQISCKDSARNIISKAKSVFKFILIIFTDFVFLSDVRIFTNGNKKFHNNIVLWNFCVGVDGFEPPTLCL